MKRGNEKGQVSRVSGIINRLLQSAHLMAACVLQEEYEAEEDHSDDEGLVLGDFKRASAEVMATRKIIKVKRYNSLL
jgi:hypothetical protein